MEQKPRSITHSTIKGKKLKLRICGWVDDNGGGQEMVELTTTMEDYRKQKKKKKNLGEAGDG